MCLLCEKNNPFVLKLKNTHSLKYWKWPFLALLKASVVAQVVKRIRLQLGIPGLGISPGGGHGNPLQYSCLENRHEQRRLVGYSPWGCKESDMTKHSIALLKVDIFFKCLF